jgi:hypothetical protein
VKGQLQTLPVGNFARSWSVPRLTAQFVCVCA